MENTDEITISKELFERIIENAFTDGETWGLTHGSWFTPTIGDTQNKINTTIKKAYFKVNRHNKKIKK